MDTEDDVDAAAADDDDVDALSAKPRRTTEANLEGLLLMVTVEVVVVREEEGWRAERRD